MARTKKDTRALSILFNLVIVVWMGYCLYNIFVKGLIGNMQGDKWIAFRYYTIDSNVFAALASLAMLIARMLHGQAKSFTTKFKFFATCTVTVTFATVVAFLGPMFGYKQMFEGDNLYMHLIGPVLCIISFCFLDRGPKLSMKAAAESLIPTAIYGTVYAVMVIVLKKWPDFYGFNIGGRWYISFAAMMLAAFAIAVVLKALHNDK